MLKKQTVSRTKPKPQIWKKYIYIAQVRGPQSLFHKFYLHWTGQPHNIETEVRTYGKNAQLLHLVFFLSVHWLSLSSKYWSVSVTSEHCFQFSCSLFLPHQTVGDECYSWLHFSNFSYCSWEHDTLLKFYWLTYKEWYVAFHSLLQLSSQRVEAVLCNFLPLPNAHV